MATLNLFPQQETPPLDTAVLPRDPPFNTPSHVSTYRLVIEAEKAAVDCYCQVRGQSQEARDAASRKVLASRVLGFLYPALWRMRHSLGDTPISVLSTEVASAKNNDKIYDLGTMYLDLLICSFRTNTTKYPPPSNHPSRPSMDQLDDMLTDAIQASGADHGSARTRALARDGYHCMLSNTIDKQSFQKHPAVRELSKKSGAAVHPIHACHIFNESLLERIDPTDEYPHQA